MKSSRSVFLSISRMLDMGGMPSAAATSKLRSIDASKNCKVRCIAFDFDLITRSATSKQDKKNTKPLEEEQKKKLATKLELSSSLPQSVQEMANLLNVKFGGDNNNDKFSSNDNYEDDDLSALTGETSHKKKKSEEEEKASSLLLLNNDIRNKYASKLRDRASNGGMSLDGIKRAKEEQQDVTLSSKGDAASHLSARAMAIHNQNSTATQWLALDGTGTLLQYVSSRNMKIILLPKPNNNNNNKEEEELKRMKTFTKQLPKISFDLLLTNNNTNNKDNTATDTILTKLTNELSSLNNNTDNTDTNDAIIIISDRDDYLRSANEMGMTTCRVRPTLNAPRGNITAHYQVTDIADVQDVINEINGISFNSVLSSSPSSFKNM